jgi:hypothetical protein
MVREVGAMRESDFLALEPRERDALVAEKVMGLDVGAHDDATIASAVFSGLRVSHGNQYVATMEWNGTEYVVPFGNAYGVDAEGNNGHGLYWWRVRKGKPWEADVEAHVAAWRARPRAYTTDIAAAWQVVEKMRAEKHFGCRTDPLMGERFNAARFAPGPACPMPPEQQREYDFVCAQTMPLAICIAALKAVGEIADG